MVIGWAVLWLIEIFYDEAHLLATVEVGVLADVAERESLIQCDFLFKFVARQAVSWSRPFDGQGTPGVADAHTNRTPPFTANIAWHETGVRCGQRLVFTANQEVAFYFKRNDM